MEGNMNKNKKKKKTYGTIITILILILFVSILSLVLSLFGLDGEIAKISNGVIQTTMVTVKNILSKDGISYLFSNTISNFNLMEPLVLLIVSMICIGTAQASGLLFHLSKPLKKLRQPALIFVTVLISAIFTLFGDYSYIILFPLIAVIFKNIDQNPLIGVTCVFLGIATCYGGGIIYNYNYYIMGNATEAAAALEIDNTYQFNLLSNFYIMLIGTVIVSIIISNLVKFKIVPKIKKIEKEEISYNTNDKALWMTNIVSIFLMFVLVYSIIPGLPLSGLLLDKTQDNYIAMLLGANSPFNKGFMFIILIIVMILSYVYGKIAGNIKNSIEFNDTLSKEFYDVGHIFVLLFFGTILFEIINWTNIANVLVANLVSIINSLQFSGLLLIVIFVIMSIILPDTITKWSMISPLIVPLFMSSNITPEFTQFIFGIADGVGKALSPFYIYFFIFLGFLQKYNKNNANEFTMRKVIKIITPSVFIIALTWLLIIVAWYVVGIPLGIGTSTII